MKSYILMAGVEMETAFTEYLNKRGIVPLRSTQRAWINAKDSEGSQFTHVPIYWDARIAECGKCNSTNLTYDIASDKPPAALCKDCGACILLPGDYRAYVLGDGSIVETTPEAPKALNMQECPHCHSKNLFACGSLSDPPHVHCSDCKKISVGRISSPDDVSEIAEKYFVKACRQCGTFGAFLYLKDDGQCFVQCKECSHRSEKKLNPQEAVTAWNN